MEPPVLLLYEQSRSLMVLLYHFLVFLGSCDFYCFISMLYVAIAFLQIGLRHMLGI